MSHRNTPTGRSVRPRIGKKPTLERLEARVVLSTVTVTRPADDANAGSLRYAITQVNLGNADTIEVDFTDLNAHTIALASPLPELTHPVAMNPHHHAIVIDGAAAGAGAEGLVLGPGSDGSSVDSFSVENFGGIGIHVISGHNTFTSNVIGLDEAATAARPNLYGIVLEPTSTFNTIGGIIHNAVLGDIPAGNYISGNVNDGILVRGSGAANPGYNTIIGNTIGVRNLGPLSVPNGGNGIRLQDTWHNTVGAAAGGSGSFGYHNVVSGNHLNGIALEGSRFNVVIGNYVGTDSFAANAVPNGLSGISLSGDGFDPGSGSNSIGGSRANEGNVISGNAGDGIFMSGSTTTGNLVQGNSIGLGLTGEPTLGNGVAGIRMIQVTGNFIGTDAAGVASPLSRNVISGNANDGVRIDGGDHNVVAGNFIGTDHAGRNARPNGSAGVSLLKEYAAAGAVANRVGGADANSRNVISGNGGSGVFIGDPTTAANQVQGNYIGLDLTGNTALPNSFAGVLILNARANFIGTDIAGVASPAFRNVISGNHVDGIRIDGGDHNVVAGNFIGTDAAGRFSRPNLEAGVSLGRSAAPAGAVANRVGGADVNSRNVISGNGGSGVALAGPTTTANQVLGNFIGVDVTGLAALGNGYSGVYLTQAPGNSIGGDSGGGAGNVIAANANDAVTVDNQSNYTVVAGNFLGTDATGRVGLGNADSGVYVANSDSVRVGSIAATPGQSYSNVIAANKKAGVTLDGATHAVIAGNVIGSDLTGTVRLSQPVGVKVENASTDNVIGGSPNAILDNALAGVSVLDSASVRNRILGNLFSNSGPGIDLGGNGVSPNLPGGTHAGPNLFQNAPALTFAANGRLGITLNAAPSTTYVIDYYASPPADPSAGPQAGLALGRLNLTTDANGAAGPVVVGYIPSAGFNVFSATATDPSGNTSELSGPAGSPPLAATPQATSFAARASASVVLGTVVDLDPLATAGRLSASINWGDNTPPTAATLVSTGTAGIFRVVGTHLYANAGSYTTSFTVVDPDLGASAVASGPAQVSPPPITVVGRNAVLRGASARFSGVVATFVDAGPKLAARSYLATVTWGDGSTSVGKVVAGKAGFSVQANHKFNRFAGARAVTVTITDASGRKAFATDQFSFAPKASR